MRKELFLNIMEQLRKVIRGIFIVLGIFGIMLVYAIAYYFWKAETLHDFGKYTIGVTEKSYYSVNSGRMVYYSFKVNGQEYENSAFYQDGVIVPDGKYYVKYYKNNPRVNEMIFTPKVNGEIGEPPIDGWDSLPAN